MSFVKLVNCMLASPNSSTVAASRTRCAPRGTDSLPWVSRRARNSPSLKASAHRCGPSCNAAFVRSLPKKPRPTPSSAVSLANADNHKPSSNIQYGSIPMFRSIAAVVVGYLVMVVLVILAFSIAFVAPNFAFRTDSFDVTLGWLAFALASGLAAAIVGGFACALIARRRSATHALAALAIVLGLGGAVSNLSKERPAATESAAGLTAMERSKRAVQPHWYAFALPFVGAIGIVIGGRLRKCPPR